MKYSRSVKKLLTIEQLKEVRFKETEVEDWLKKRQRKGRSSFKINI